MFIVAPEEVSVDATMASVTSERESIYSLKKRKGRKSSFIYQLALLVAFPAIDLFG